jgi:hypothetical protein
MAKEEPKVIEQGDIFFFYRPKVDTKEVKDISNVQRFYMATAPEGGKYRLFVVGQKQMPEIAEGRSTASERNWALNVLTTPNPDDIRKELLPAEYPTETKGTRRIGAAAPAGEGKYSIVEHDNHTELAYVLELPEVPGPAQREFEIKKEASYIMSVKNPDIQVRGFAAFENRKPQYPSSVKEKFRDKRWINIDDPDLLNYENAQILLIGARKKDVEEELGIDLNEERENANTAELFRELKVKKEQVPLKPLLEGKFPRAGEQSMSQETRQLSREEAPGRGGKKGGQAAATRAPSAAAVAKILSGTDFPKGKKELVRHAERNRQKVEAAEEIINVIRELPDRRYSNMADVEKALAEVR